MGRTVLITGCSSGIGRATARRFLADDWIVYATARDQSEITELEEAGAVTAQLDVTSTADVEQVVERLVAEQGRFDCLINNGGFGQMGPVEDVPIDEVREQYDVNTFGPYRLMRAAIPYMRDQGTGTIINVTSISDRLPFAGSAVYSGSKSALATTSEVVRQEVRGQGIDVVVIEPSFVATDFYDRMLDELDDLEHSPEYADLYELLEQLRVVEGGGPGIVSPEAVADTILEAANSDSPEGRYEVGSLAKAGSVLAMLLPESWRTPIMRAAIGVAVSPPAQRLLTWLADR